MNSPGPGALAHDDEVQITERSPDAGARAGRPDVGVKVELDAKGGRNVHPALVSRRIVQVRDRPEQDAVDLSRAGEDPVGKRRAGLLERGETDVGELELQPQAEAAVGRIEDAERRRRDLGADAVTGQDQDVHGSSRSAHPARPGRKRTSWGKKMSSSTTPMVSST
jgi:hypothetical protein